MTAEQVRRSRCWRGFLGLMTLSAFSLFILGWWEISCFSYSARASEVLLRANADPTVRSAFLAPELQEVWKSNELYANDFTVD